MKVVGVILGAFDEMRVAKATTGKARVAVIDAILPPVARFDHLIEWRTAKSGRKWIKVKAKEPKA